MKAEAEEDLCGGRRRGENRRYSHTCPAIALSPSPAICHCHVFYTEMKNRVIDCGESSVWGRKPFLSFFACHTSLFLRVLQLVHYYDGFFARGKELDSNFAVVAAARFDTIFIGRPGGKLCVKTLSPSSSGNVAV